MLSSHRAQRGAIGAPKGNSQLQEIWLEVQDPKAHMPKKVPQQRTLEEERDRALSNKERKEEIDRLASMRRQRCNWYPSEALQRRRHGEAMPDDEREEARERLYRMKSSFEPRQKAATNLGHVLANGEMSAASLVKVKFARDRPKARLRVSSRKKIEEPNWMGLGGRGGKPPELPNAGGKPAPESTAASIDGSCVQRDPDAPDFDEHGEPIRDEDKQPPKPKPIYQSLTARAYFNNDWKPGDSYRKYKPASHGEAWQNLKGFIGTTRTLEHYRMNPLSDINSFTAGVHVGAYVRPIDVKGQLGARSIQKWKEQLREDFARDNDNSSSNSHDAEMEELRKLLHGAGTPAAKAKSEVD